MKRNPLTLIIALLLILIFGFLLFSFQVRTTEVAVVTTFGKPTRPITEPNLYFKWPWPIQKVWTFDRRVQNFEDRLTEGLTSDSFNLLTSVYVGWKVSDPTAFFPRFAGSANPIAAAETLLDQWLGNAKTAVVGKHPLADFVSTSDNGAAFLAIENEILDGHPIPNPHQQPRVAGRIPRHQALAAPGKRQPVGVRPHDLRAEGAGRSLPI